VGLDGDAALAFEVHIVEQLLFHIAVGHGAGELQNAVSEGRFAVVDVGNYGEISY
jgi:hypothetical protein